MTPELAHWMIVAGRVLMGGFYVVAGVDHFLALGQLTKLIAVRNVPAPRLVLIAGSLVQIVGGLLLMVGLLSVFAALALVLFTLVAGVMLLNFWDKHGDERRTAIGHWQSNLALIGGLLSLAVAP
jgi:putative oxidoreductase